MHGVISDSPRWPAWIRRSKFVAPISVWCNWLAWSPVLALRTGLLPYLALAACIAVILLAHHLANPPG